MEMFKAKVEQPGLWRVSQMGFRSLPTQTIWDLIRNDGEPTAELRELRQQQMLQNLCREDVQDRTPKFPIQELFLPWEHSLSPLLLCPERNLTHP